MPLLHQSNSASRDSMVIGQHILYACGMSQVVRRETPLQSRGASGIVEKWKTADREESARARRRTIRAGRRVAVTESVSAFRGKAGGCHRSTAARHEER